jgi:ribonuclease HI
LWSLVIDDLLIELNGSGGIFAQGYADDVFILVKGKFTNTVLDVFQRSLHIVQRFCESVGLSVNPAKTTVIPFSTKQNLGMLKVPVLYGQNLSFSKEVKYLGVHLDSKLNWNLHIDSIVEKAKKSFWACRSIVGRNWGLKPRMMYWLYEQVILPRITYGCVVWWNKLKQTSASSKLDRIQRAAELAITGAWKTTPALALDRLLELPPLRFRIEAVARSTAYKLAINRLWVYDWIFSGHMELNRFLRENLVSIFESDRVVCTYSFDKHYKVDLLEDLSLSSDHIGIYTDASKSEAGVGIGIFSNDLELTLLYKLQDHANVFQAEVYAIGEGVNHCINSNIKGRRICFLTDSRAALLALNNCMIRSNTVLECVSSLNLLGQDNDVAVRWIPGHSGIEGNENADRLAKEAVCKEDYDKSIYYSLSMVKSEIQEWLKRQHFRHWNSEEGALTAKRLIGPVNRSKLKDVLELSKGDLRILIGALTGHMSINSFLVKLNLSNSKFCRFCNRYEETMIHILCECRVIVIQRLRHFNKDFINAEDIRKHSYRDIVGYIKELGLSQ